jgi:MYXO-CTERM domain-containing protein
MKTKSITATLVALAAVCLATPASAALLVQDQFQAGDPPALGEYNSATALVGQGPASATGFSGNWSSVTAGTGSSNSIVTGLTYLSLITAGSAAQVSGGNTRINHLLANPFTASTTGTFYMSLLFQGSDTDGQFRSVEFHNGGNAGADRNFFLGMGGGSGGFGDGSTQGIRLFGDTGATSLGASNTDVNMFVLKLELSSTNLSDTLTVYRNPTDLLVEGNNTVGATFTGRNIAFDRLSLALFSTGTVTLDEFRIGDTFADVTPVPEPSSAAFLLLGVALLVAHRVRRSRQSA